MKRIHLLVIMFIWIGVDQNPVFAQESYGLSWYTDSEGLPQNSVKSIFKDKYGFIWLSTNGGLARYDGANFKTFNSENIPNTNADPMRTFFGNVAKDSVYTANADGEPILINQRIAQKAPPEPVGISSAPETSGKPYSPFNYPANSRSNLLTGASTGIGSDTSFISTQPGFIGNRSRYKINATAPAYPYGNSMAGQYFSINGTRYNLTSKGGLYRFSKGVQTKLSVNPAPLKNVTVFVNEASGQVFFYTGQDLWLVERIERNKIVKKELATGLNLYPAKISSFFFDENTGSIYVGSLNKGLGVIKKTSFHTLLNPLEGIGNIIYGMTKVNDSTLITGTGWVIQDDQIIQQNDFEKVSDNLYLVYLNKSLWTFKANRLYQLKNIGDYRFVPVDTYKIKDGSDYSLLLPKGTEALWLATSNLLHTEGTLYSKSVKSQNPGFHKIVSTNFRITALIQINKDSIYLGDKNGGLYLLKDYRHHPKIEIIDPDLKVSGFHRDGSNFWVTSYNRGFAHMKGKSLTYLPLDKNHYLRTAHCILDDGHGYFWLTTNRGLFRVLKSNLYKFIGNLTNHVYYNYYDKSYGFSTNEFNGGCHACGLKMKNDRIYFPSLDGVVVFSSTGLKEEANGEGIYIEAVKTDNSVHAGRDSLNLERGFKRLTVFVAYPFYSPLNNVNVQAQLRGENETHPWAPIGADRKISYTNLSPGHYTFKVRKRSTPSQNFQTGQIHIYIPPAYWQTLWFRLLIALLSALIIGGAIALWIKNLKQKKRRLEKKVELRTRFLRKTIRQLRTTENNLIKELSFQKSITGSISHDLITPTKYLATFSDQLYRNPENYTQYNSSEMALIHQTSRQIKTFIENLLIYTKANIDELDETKETISLRDLIDDCKQFLEIPLHEQSNILENEIDPQVTLHVNVYILKIIIQNILDNAIKNTTNGKISVSCETGQSVVHILVEDDGIGMEEDMLAFYRGFFTRKDLGKDELNTVGLGFKIIKQLLPYVEGNIDIDSFVSRGTTFKITCKP